MDGGWALHARASTHARTHASTHARTHTHAHTHTHCPRSDSDRPAGGGVSLKCVCVCVCVCACACVCATRVGPCTRGSPCAIRVDRPLSALLTSGHLSTTHASTGPSARASDGRPASTSGPTAILLLQWGTAVQSGRRRPRLPSAAAASESEARPPAVGRQSGPAEHQPCRTGPSMAAKTRRPTSRQGSRRRDEASCRTLATGGGAARTRLRAWRQVGGPAWWNIGWNIGQAPKRCERASFRPPPRPH